MQLNQSINQPNKLLTYRSIGLSPPPPPPPFPSAVDTHQAKKILTKLINQIDYQSIDQSISHPPVGQRVGRTGGQSFRGRPGFDAGATPVGTHQAYRVVQVGLQVLGEQKAHRRKLPQRTCVWIVMIYVSSKTALYNICTQCSIAYKRLLFFFFFFFFLLLLLFPFFFFFFFLLLLLFPFFFFFFFLLLLCCCCFVVFGFVLVWFWFSLWAFLCFVCVCVCFFVVFFLGGGGGFVCLFVFCLVWGFLVFFWQGGGGGGTSFLWETNVRIFESVA